MSTQAPGTNHNGAQAPWAMPNPLQEVYEQLLALADKVGAACTEAYQEIGAAYADAFQQTAVRIGSLQDKLADQEPVDWQALLTPAASPTDQLTTAKDRTLAIGERFREVSRTIGLAYLDAGEKAALAAVKAHEQISAASPVDVVKDSAARRAEMARSVTQASASSIRQLVT